MPHPRLRILSMPDLDEARGAANLPRALQRHSHSTHPCGACNAACCRTASVELTTVEALRLAFGALLSLDAVVQRMSVPAGEARTPRLASRPIPLVDGAVVLRLRHSVLGGCTFITHVLDQSRCGVHALRPGVCRFYPFHFQAGGQNYQVGNGSLCPTQWVRTDALETALARDVRQWRKDLRMEARLLKQWKAAGGARGQWHHYAAFAMAFAQREMGLSAPVVVERQGRGLGKRLW